MKPHRQTENKVVRPLERKSAAEGTGLARRETRSYAFALKAVSDSGIIEGYGSVFGHRDSYDDIVAPGAFSTTLQAHKAAGTMPAMLWQHKPDEPIGVWLEMVEDQRGLRVRGQLALDTTRGKEAHALLKMGAINGLSIGFVAEQWTYDRETDVRTITEVDLWELSPVTFPANSEARVTSVKSAGDLVAPKDAERILRDAGFSKTDATAFVSRVMRMGEVRRESAQAAAKANAAAQRLLNELKQGLST